MSVWAAGVALAVVAAACLAGEATVVLSALAEIAAVVALFMLVCATEALN